MLSRPSSEHYHGLRRDRGEYRQAAGASYSLKVIGRFFPGLGFPASRQVAGLQTLPYPLHDFAGAFLAAAPSFDKDNPHAGTLIAGKVKKPSPHCTCGTGRADAAVLFVTAQLQF